VNLHIYLILGLALFILGWICLITQKNAFKQVIGLKIMLQSVTLAMILAGLHQDNLHLAQALVISALVVEAIIIALALAMIVSIYRDIPSGNIDLLRKLRG
jgi:NADH:ubiquinone oxidoreductase subunit K